MGEIQMSSDRCCNRWRCRILWRYLEVHLNLTQLIRKVFWELRSKLKIKSSSWKIGRNTPGTGNIVCEVLKWVGAWHVEHLKVLLKGWNLKRELKLLEGWGWSDIQGTNHEGLVSHVKELVLYAEAIWSH